MEISKVGVIGAGTMGNGIAHVFAQNGYAVQLVDVKTEFLDNAMAMIRNNFVRQVKKGAIAESEVESILKNISKSTDLQSLKDVQLVVEAASENSEIKKEIFRKLDRLLPREAILASNTSSISITELAAATHRADRFIGMHFFNPVPVMKLVEVIRGLATSMQPSIW